MRRVLLAVALCAAGSAARGEGWQAGVARRAITPEGPIWMAGYASRDRPSEGALHDLWAKALAIRDPQGNTALLVTIDVCGIDRDFSLSVRNEIRERHGLDLGRIVLACSHTHSGPVLGDNLRGMYPLDEQQTKRVVDYTARLRRTLVEVAGEAIEAIGPGELSWAIGHCDFAVNRRNNDQAKADELRARIALQGPVDHDVPVLKVARPGGELAAVVCLYACHCTTLAINQLSGDYAGFAQIALERAYPGAQAMFVAGCGGDQNPLPRGTVEHAERYGTQLAEAVERALAGGMTPVSGALATAYAEVDLEFAPFPDRAHWEAEAKSANIAFANRAKRMLQILDEKGSLPTTYPYPVQVWRLGPGLTWIFLGGEVTVEYSLRLKRNLGSSRTWVAAYCNDVMAYIPSKKVLNEGGYEGGGSMVYYGLPGPWSEDVEERIVAAVRSLLP